MERDTERGRWGADLQRGCSNEHQARRPQGTRGSSPMPGPSAAPGPFLPAFQGKTPSAFQLTPILASQAWGGGCVFFLRPHLPADPGSRTVFAKAEGEVEGGGIGEERSACWGLERLGQKGGGCSTLRALDTKVVSTQRFPPSQTPVGNGKDSATAKMGHGV